jgi:tetratricopeptide (TPR) repeat protein
MSRLPQFQSKTVKITAVVVAVIAILITLLFGLRYTSAFHSPARSAFDRANREVLAANLPAAIADYQLADFLSPADHAARHQLADLYVAQNNPASAISTLKSLPVGESGVQIARLQRQTGQLDAATETIYRTLRASESSEAYAEKTRILLEKGEGSGAVYNAERAAQLQASADNQQLQGLSYLINNQPDLYKTLMPTVSSPEALQTLTRANQGKYPLATVLYASGLPRSAERVLNAYVLTSAAEYRLLGQVQETIAVNDTGYWSKARTSLEQATKMDPSSLDGHKLLLVAYEKLNLKTEADQQKTLISALESGKV